MPWRQKMILLSLLTPLKIASSTSIKMFLKRPEGILLVLRAIRQHKMSVERLRPCRFFDAQDAENIFTWPFNSMNHGFIVLNKFVFY
jgi:hypothetical protein